MLLTTCPNCAAQFKVYPDQLNVRQGQVMCGQCRNIFNAFQTLARVSDSELLLLTVKTTEFPNTDISSEKDKFEVLPQDPPSNKLESIPPKFAWISTQRGEGENLEPFDENVKIDQAIPQVGVVASAPLSIASTEITHSFLNQPLKTNFERPLMWGLGCMLLFLLMASQSLYQFRNPILQVFPQAHPTLAKMCAFLQCTLSWGRDDKAVVIESSDLIESPGKSGQYLLSAVIANRSEVAQDLPALNVRLTDSVNQLVIRRTLLPADYLGRPPKTDENIASNSQLFVNLNVNIDPKISASGYTYEAFYP